MALSPTLSGQRGHSIYIFPCFTVFARFTFSTKYNLHFHQIQSSFSNLLFFKIFQEYFMEELCYISKRFLCPDGTFVLQRDIEYWKSLTTSKGAGTYQDSKAFQINPHYFYVEVFVN